MIDLHRLAKLYDAYYTLHDENRRILYDKKIREEHHSSVRNTKYGEDPQSRQTPRRNSRGRDPSSSESDDDDEWEESARTAEEGQGHERAERTKREKEARERADRQAKQKEEQEWFSELQARLESLLRRRKKIKTMKANIEDMDQEDAEILDSEQRLKGRTAYRTSIWDQVTENEEMERAKRRTERLQARSSATIKLGWEERELKQSEIDYKMFLSLQSRQRREDADRVEAALRATAEQNSQQEAKQKRAREKDVSDRLAREKEDRRREAEARHRGVDEEHEGRESAREEARKAELRERQKDEAARRQRILEKIEKQRQETMRQGSQSPYPTGPEPTDSGPNPGHVHTSEGSFAADAQRTRSGMASPSRSDHQPRFRTGSPPPAEDPRLSSGPRDRERSYESDSDGEDEEIEEEEEEEEEGYYCYHGDFWPKIRGGQRCSHCARFCNAFIFRCPDCGILACGFCRDRLRASGG